MVKASIIVLAYNQLENATKPCIESLYKNTSTEDFELIVVDNNSSDGTDEYLKDLQSKYENLKIILNQTNRGYAGGNNDGIKTADGDIVILLNNDTLVTPGWLPNLLAPFENDSELGLVGPVTNNSQNEQCLSIKDINPENYEALSEVYTKKNSSLWFETSRLIFFCVAIKKQVIDQIGMLDENFKRGFYEDDDYCARAKKSGYKLAIAEDSFVYHHCGLTFTNAYQNFDFAELLSTNKKLFMKKHKIYSIQSDRINNFFKKIEKDLEQYKKENPDVDKNIERIFLRLEKFNWQIEEARLSESYLVKKYQGAFLSAVFRVIKDNFKPLRKFEYLSRNFFKKFKQKKN